jgi:hypothetical protein
MSKEGINLPKSEKSPKKAFIFHSKWDFISFGNKIFYSKISKEGIILQNSVKLKTNSTHLAKTNFTVKLHFVKGKSAKNV